MIYKGILLISTRRYKQYVQTLINQIDKYFLTGDDKKIFVFTDEYQKLISSEDEIVQILIPDYKYPFATLYRYKIFSEHETEFEDCSHLFYLDVDTGIIDTVGYEFITDTLVAVRHPGMYKNDGWGDSNNPIESKSYLPKELRKHYYCGGTQGGRADLYLEAAKQMANGIAEDEAKGIKAEHNDETFWNHYIHTSGVPITEFTPEYCIPEEVHLREAWGLSHLTPKILALSKNHEEIRS